MEKNKTLIFAGETAIVVSCSPLLALPGEIRIKIYDHVFGTKPLQLLPRYRTVPASNSHNSGRTYFRPGQKYVPIADNHGLYTLRQTCRQIATETEHYLFHTLDFSGRRGETPPDGIQSHIDAFQQMLQARWGYVRHLVINSYAMGFWLADCEDLAPPLPLPGVVDLWSVDALRADANVFWPADARNLTTITIYDMNKRKAEEREKLLKVLRFYFPNLVDVRCSYTGDNECMRRYRITDDGQLKWWYSGGAFQEAAGRAHGS